MAHSTLPVLPHPRFPQFPYDGSFIDRLLHLAEVAVSSEICAGESLESSRGASDGGEPCRKKATVHDPRSGRSFCLDCFDGIIL